MPTLRKPVWPRRRIARVVLQSVCAIHLFHEHIAQIRACAGASMYPTLGLEGDLVLQSRLLLQLRPIERGSLVTSVSPANPSHQVLKRVIGIEGDTICIDPSGERRRDEESRLKTWRMGEGMLVVPKGHVWLAGDNTSNSTDSRDYGPAPVALVRGRVVARVWPNPRWLSPNTHTVASV